MSGVQDASGASNGWVTGGGREREHLSLAADALPDHSPAPAHRLRVTEELEDVVQHDDIRSPQTRLALLRTHVRLHNLYACPHNPPSPMLAKKW